MEATVEQLIACLEALDAADQRLAAAHVNAAIEILIAGGLPDTPAQETEA